MGCLVLRGLKSALILTYKLVFDLVPLGSSVIAPLEAKLPQTLVAGNTRAADRLMAHPCPIRPVGSLTTGIWIPPSDTCFAARMSAL